MRNIFTLLFSSVVILNSIDSSLQFEHSHDNDPNPGFRGSRSPAYLSSNPPSCSARFSISADTSLRGRSRSRSPFRQYFATILGYKFEDLARIRLSPYSNPNHLFELRKYTFPPDRPIGFRGRSKLLNVIPPEEKFVLTKSNGDVCAILERLPNRHIIFRAIYTIDPVSTQLKRAKINIYSGMVEELTTRETVECPASLADPITKNYRVLEIPRQGNDWIPSAPENNEVLTAEEISSLLNHLSPVEDFDDRVLGHTSLPSTSAEHDYSDHQLVRRRHSFSVTPHSPARPPLAAGSSIRSRSKATLKEEFPRLLGYRFEELLSIRLSPKNNPNRTFVLRIYVFPPDQPIGWRSKNNVLDPIPSREEIVLSTLNGDVCATLGKSANRQTVLRAIYLSQPITGHRKRAKINIDSGEIKELTSEEIAECPVYDQDVFKKRYIVTHV